MILAAGFAACAIVAISLVIPSHYQAPDTAIVAPTCDYCGTDPRGAYFGYTLEQTVGLRQQWPPGARQDHSKWFEYSAVIQCAGNTPDYPDNVLCRPPIDYCLINMPSGSGPYSLIYRRIVDASGPLTNWDSVRFTCFTDAVPPRSGEDAELTEAVIFEQFHRTEFALPSTSLQPPDNRTLVNLPVYYELTWPAEGFQPGEVDTSTLLGHQVRIRPLLQSVTYHFGDDSSEGPSQSLGGPYPTGDITHTYLKSGTVQPHISVTYSGEYSIDGGPFSAIPGTATVDGPIQPLQILTSKNRLYGN